jgi:hypothetical protein
MAKYVCVGNVRGSCGHAHRTITGAAKCLRRERANCRKNGGYSDRRIAPVEVDSYGDHGYLSDEEYDEADKILRKMEY